VSNYTRSPHTRRRYSKSRRGRGRDSSHVDIAWANSPPRRRDSRFRHANRRNSRRDALLVCWVFAANDFQRVGPRSMFDHFLVSWRPGSLSLVDHPSNARPVHPQIVHHRTRLRHLVSPAASGHGGGEGKGLTPVCKPSFWGTGRVVSRTLRFSAAEL
jgi:hypothetical protein